MMAQPRLWLRNTLDHSVRHLIWGFRCRLLQFGVSRESAVKISIAMERCLKKAWIIG